LQFLNIERWCAEGDTTDLLQVHAMTKDTQDIMSRAQEQSNTADAQAAELQRVRLKAHGTLHRRLAATAIVLDVCCN
jgi:hypothetical protein